MHHSKSSTGRTVDRQRDHTPMSRLANRLWEYPPRPPSPPPPRSLSSPSSSWLSARGGMRSQPVPVARFLHRLEGIDLDTMTLSPAKTPHIHALAPEILIDIFCFVAAFEQFATHFSATRGVLKLMLVCGYWRALVLEASTLWRHIHSAHHPSWVSLCLARSRECLLDVQIYTSGPTSLDSLRLVSQHAWRMRSFRATLCWSVSESEVLGLLFEAAAVRSSITSPRAPAAEPCMCPYLRTLVLEGIVPVLPDDLWRPLLALRSLRVLKLTDRAARLPAERETALAFFRLMQLVARNTSLEQLVLHFYSQFHTISAEGVQAFLRDSQRALPEMSLPRLGTLSVHGTHAFVSVFTQHLHFSEDIPDVDVRVQYTRDADHTATTLTLPRPLRQILERVSDVMLVGILGSPAQICSPRPTWPARRRTDSPRQIRFSFECRPPDYVETTLSRVALLLTPVAVRKLTIKASLARPPAGRAGDVSEALSDAAAAAFWAALLDCVPSVEELCVLVPPTCPSAVRIDLLGVLRALQPRARTSQQPGGDAVQDASQGTGQGPLELPRCPLLARLSIHGQFGGDAGEMTDALGGVVDCVRDRARGSARLGVLDLHFWYWGQSEREPVGEARRASLRRARDFVGSLQSKFGASAGCRGCR
ncbi:hypothetical protein BC628DRAFT_791082 [Trametes gibbosa]|nr:hypothetical protein BC628DRAFT_791082 [Trametes gibbosa]